MTDDSCNKFEEMQGKMRVGATKSKQVKVSW